MSYESDIKEVLNNLDKEQIVKLYNLITNSAKVHLMKDFDTVFGGIPHTDLILRLAKDFKMSDEYFFINLDNTINSYNTRRPSDLINIDVLLDWMLSHTIETYIYEEDEIKPKV